jgi:putative ATP-dependent endonuclease of the OLD family
MISNVQCTGYRSLEAVSVPCTMLTALVGPNGAGKTSILSAVDLVLGPRWPTLGSFRVPHDFTAFDTNRNVEIAVTFDPPLSHQDTLGTVHEVPTLAVRCRQYKRSGKWGEAGDLHVDFEPRNSKGDVPLVAVGRAAGGKPEFRPLTVGTGLRNQARVLHIDHRRSLAQHLPSTRGSVLGRLLAGARKQFEDEEGDAAGRTAFAERYQAAMDALRTDRVIEIENTIASTAKRMVGFLGSRTLGDVDIRFGFADPANPFSSLRLEYSEGELVVPGDQLGLGVQSAIVVGVFEALRRLGEPVGTVIIEEPEMYLHPQAQRYFYRLLAEMADGDEAQVIYSTHSPVFAEAARYESIRLVRRAAGGNSSVSYVRAPQDRAFLDSQRTAQKFVTGFTATRNEMFFARKVLLVEGPGDQLAVRFVAERLGFDLDGEDLAVVECGGKTAIPFYARVCTALQIEYVVLHDEDLYPAEGSAEREVRIRADNAREEEMNAKIAAAVADTNRVFTLAPSLEAALGIGRGATDKPRRVAEALDALDAGLFPESLSAAVQALFA